MGRLSLGNHQFQISSGESVKYRLKGWVESKPKDNDGNILLIDASEYSWDKDYKGEIICDYDTDPFN